MVSQATGMEGRRIEGSVYEIQHAKMHTDQELYTLKMRLVDFGLSLNKF